LPSVSIGDFFHAEGNSTILHDQGLGPILNDD